MGEHGGFPPQYYPPYALVLVVVWYSSHSGVGEAKAVEEQSQSRAKPSTALGEAKEHAEIL